MKRISHSGRVLFAGLSGFAMLLGAAVFLGPASDAADARGPIGGPLCGPTYMWDCTGPGGNVQFAGTACDKFVFERATGSTCVPASN